MRQDFFLIFRESNSFRFAAKSTGAEAFSGSRSSIAASSEIICEVLNEMHDAPLNLGTPEPGKCPRQSQPICISEKLRHKIR